MHRPALEPGVTLAHYQIVGRLGAGGMGDVYRAHDTVLGRQVALKILPPHVVRNEERQRRFVQEARAASSLNHPHIVTIYEIGETVAANADGDAETVHYIAMELVDGVTLGTKIHDEQVALRTLVGYLAQAAEGLAKAHAAGIVHRDLKPANIMVSADGFTKVLDFGLAKLVPAADGSDATRTRIARDDTGEGVVLGTVAYMSPEQVQGRAADHRSDIFAMGAILYEAATRQRPFVADSDVEVMHRILRDKPEPIAELNPAVPAELRRTIRRCLAKEPERRFQSMKDLAIELSEIVDEYDELAAATSSGSGSTAGMAAVAARSRGPSRRMIVAAAVVAIALLSAGFLWTRSRATTDSPISFGTMQMRPITTSGDVTESAISPDGKFVAYVTRASSRYAVWLHQVATGSRTPLVVEQDDPIAHIEFAPDGSYLYYTRADAMRGNYLFSWLYAMPVLGGPSRKVVFDVDTAPAFSPDASRLAFGRGVPRENENHVVIVSADGSDERTLVKFPRRENALGVVWTPDGQKVLTSFIEMAPDWRAVAVEVDVATGTQRRLSGPRMFWIDDLQMLPDASALLMVAADSGSARNQIWLQPYPEGAPVRVTNDLSNYDGVSVTQDGALIAAERSETSHSLAVVGRSDREHGRPVLPAIERGGDDHITAASTGAMAFSAVTRGPGAPSLDIHVLDPAATTPRLVTRGGENFGPSFTADGRTLVFWREAPDAPARVYMVNADGTGLRPLTEGDGEMHPDISSDGRILLYAKQNRREVWVRSVAGGEPRKLTGDATPAGARLSPDGRLAVFLEWTDASHTAEHLKVVPVDGGAPLLDIAVQNVRDLAWHPRGDAITFLRTVAGVSNIFALPIVGGDIRQLTRFERGSLETYAWIDEERLALVPRERRADVVLISDWRR